jgi:hypothetical protein
MLVRHTPKSKKEIFNFRFIVVKIIFFKKQSYSVFIHSSNGSIQSFRLKIKP